MPSNFKHINASEQIFDGSITSSLFAPNILVSSLNTDTNPALTGAIQLISGTNVSLSQIGNVITINSSTPPATPFNSIQFNDSGVFGGSSDFTWDNVDSFLDLQGAIPSLPPALRLHYDDGSIGANIALQPISGTDSWVLISAGQVPGNPWTTSHIQLTTFSTVNEWDWDFNSDGSLTVPGQIHNLVDPTSAQDAATKNYVDTHPTTPAAPVNSIQFNNAGAFGSDSNLTYIVATQTLSNSWVTLDNTGLTVFASDHVTPESHLDIDGSAYFLGGRITLTSSSGLMLSNKNYVSWNDTANDATISVSAAPSSLGYTLYLPSTVPIAGQVLGISGLDPDSSGAWDLAWTSGGGSQVLPQVLQNTSTVQTTVTSSTVVGVGASQVITLQKTTNRVKVTVSMYIDNTSSSIAYLSILMDGTSVAGGAFVVSDYQGNSFLTATYIVSPGDVSSHTFQGGGNNSDIGTSYFGGLIAVIILEEILS